MTTSDITNIADPAERDTMMRKTVQLLQKDRDLGFVLLSVVAAFIDGLVRAPRGKTREMYLAYLKLHFPEACTALGAEIFYSHIRNAAIHEFAPRPPIAVAHDEKLHGKYTHTLERGGQQWTVFNVDRFVSDFIRHLDSVSSSRDAAGS
jgi:hypothetical protein